MKIGWVIVSPFLTKVFSLGRADGIVIFPFIFLAKKPLQQQPVFINHEKIHFAQILETGIIPFYIFYLLEFLWNYIKFRNRNEAYRKISFEREAYSNENNLEYLKTRRLWAFRTYLKNVRNA